MVSICHTLSQSHNVRWNVREHSHWISETFTAANILLVEGAFRVQTYNLRMAYHRAYKNTIVPTSHVRDACYQVLHQGYSVRARPRRTLLHLFLNLVNIYNAHVLKALGLY